MLQGRNKAAQREKPGSANRGTGKTNSAINPYKAGIKRREIESQNPWRGVW